MKKTAAAATWSSEVVRPPLAAAATSFLLWTNSALACPMCREIVANQKDPAAAGRLASGFAWSLGILLSAPYLLFGFITFMIVRSVRRSKKQGTAV